jgi:hypothetical protein
MIKVYKDSGVAYITWDNVGEELDIEKSIKSLEETNPVEFLEGIPAWESD